MAVFALAPLLATIINLALGIFVFTRNPRATLNKVFILFTIALTIWNGGIFVMFLAENADQALTISRALHFGVIFSPYLFIHVAALILKIPIRKTYYLAYLLPVIFSIANLSDLFITDVIDAGYAWYGTGGTAFTAFMTIYLFIVILFTVLAVYKWKSAQHLDKTKITYLLIAKAGLLFFGFHDALPIYSIYEYPIIGGTVYPLFTIGSAIYGILVGYSVLQHQILDIYTSLGRIAATLTRILFLFFFYTLLILILGLLFPNHFSFAAILGSLIVFLTSILMSSIFFPKLIGFGEDRLEKKLLGDRFEYQDRVRFFISQIPFYSNDQELLIDVNPILIETLGLRNYAIFTYESESDSYRILDSVPELETSKQDLSLTRDSYIVKHFLGLNSRLNGLANSKELLNLWNLNDTEQTATLGLGVKLCFPLRNGRDLHGFLMIGEKTRNRPLTAIDVELCQSMADNLGLFIAQAELKRQVADAHELELLGNLSRGLAHDLNNLITPISTYFQLNEEPNNGDSLKDFGRLAQRNLQTMQAYIKESLFFSTNQNPVFRPKRLASLLNSTALLQKHYLSDRNLQLDLSCPDDLEVSIDEILFQRLVSNLIHNAIDASSPGGIIELKVTPLPRRADRNKWIRLIVKDYGVGIPKEDIERVFTPYFTTKNTGDSKRGSGLGLSICRRIVDLHNGALSIYSEVGNGTRVEIDLPIAPSTSADLSPQTHKI
ncbi:MAG TPA: ATP-binding protein [Opitutales bacterium]|nr:ATP-binding protein [Opitutales bacterium]